jgi:hypothetical protein
MWATLAIASALSLAPAQAGNLEIKNDRITYGILGQERKDNKLLAGDVFVVTFDIEGLQVKDDGRVKYSMGMELINDTTKKAEFTKEPTELEAVNALGGSRLPAFALSEIGTETAPGNYTLKVTVADLNNKTKTTTLTRQFVVVPRKFGFVRVALTNEREMPVPALAVPGQTFLVNFAVIGFDLDQKNMQPDLAVEMRILDEAGKPTLTKAFTGDAKSVPAAFKKIVPMQFVLAVNRTGTFTIELTATDKVANKTDKQTMKFKVVEIPN